MPQAQLTKLYCQSGIRGSRRSRTRRVWWMLGCAAVVLGSELQCGAPIAIHFGRISPTAQQELDDLNMPAGDSENEARRATDGLNSVDVYPLPEQSTDFVCVACPSGIAQLLRPSGPAVCAIVITVVAAADVRDRSIS